MSSLLVFNPPNMRKINAGELLALGILSIVCCSCLAPLAWINASNALRMIDEQGYDASERGLVVAARICGIIGTVLLIIWLLAVWAKVSSGNYGQ